MTEASRGRVTITLGRSGQVVKRAGTVSDVHLSDSLRNVGSKRSIRDRLGSNSDSGQVNSKRLRGDTNVSGFSTKDDLPVSRGDLRFKLMQKNESKQARNGDDQRFVDLRQKLSKTGQPSSRGLDTRQRMPESKEVSILGRIPLTRTADDLPQMNLSRNSYSPWTLDHIRRRSPDRVLTTSRGLSPPRNVGDIPRRPLSRTYDDVRTVPYMSKDVNGSARPVNTTPYMTKPTLPSGSAKLVQPGPLVLGQLPPTSIISKSSYTGEEPQTVDGLLQSLGLGKYAILFKAEEVDMTALKQMGENDLKELGIPMGPRKKILLALLPRSKRQP